MMGNLDQASFRKSIKGRETEIFFLENTKGVQAAITNYGARIVSLVVPDERGKDRDIVTGFDTLDGYLNATETYHGSIVGRYANRIARGRFSIDGKEYQLAINNPPNHLHGGPHGFHTQVWEVKQATKNLLHLSYFSPDGEEHYPGNLTVDLRYELGEDNSLELHYHATSDQTTIFNITSHPFFNLNGQGTSDIDRHLLQINADNYNPVGADLIPTGINTVEGTPFDFRKPVMIGARINEKNPQLVYGAGYDHNYVLNEDGFRVVAQVQGDESGILMEVLTDQPGMQLYSGNYMKGENTIKYGLKDNFRFAFCLETQHFPDSPNHPDFPSTLLRPEDAFQSRTFYRFR
jgi:aldose 1-epimerase